MSEYVMTALGSRQAISKRLRERDSFGEPQIFGASQSLRQQFLLIHKNVSIRLRDTLRISVRRRLHILRH